MLKFSKLITQVTIATGAMIGTNAFASDIVLAGDGVQPFCRVDMKKNDCKTKFIPVFPEASASIKVYAKTRYSPMNSQQSARVSLAALNGTTIKSTYVKVDCGVPSFREVGKGAVELGCEYLGEVITYKNKTLSTKFYRAEIANYKYLGKYSGNYISATISEKK